MAWKRCLLTVVLGASLLAAPAGATQMNLDPVGEGFENFTDGALNGQGTWSSGGSSPKAFVASYAQEGYAPQGVKYMYLNKTGSGYSTLPTPYTNSTLECTFFIRAASLSVIQSDGCYWSLMNSSGSNVGTRIRLGDSGGASQYLYYDGGSSYVALDINGDGALDSSDNFAAGNWYEFHLTISLDTADETKNDTWTLQMRDIGAPGSLNFTGSFLTAKDSVSGSTVLATKSDVDDIGVLQVARPGTTGSGSLSFDTVPEPATMLLLAAGGLGVLLRRKR